MSDSRPINLGEQTFVKIGFHSRDQAIDCLCQKVFGATPSYADQKPDFPEPDLEPLSKRVDRIHLLEREIADLERQLGETRETISDVMRALELLEYEGPRLAAMRIRGELAEVTKQRDELLEVLEKLASCDWVITLPDRMDAVREIAKQAIQIVRGGDA